MFCHLDSTRHASVHSLMFQMITDVTRCRRKLPRHEKRVFGGGGWCSLRTKDGAYRVKSGNFGHQVNSDIPLQTVEIQMIRLLMTSHQDLHCLFILFTLNFYSNN